MANFQLLDENTLLCISKPFYDSPFKRTVVTLTAGSNVPDRYSNVMAAGLELPSSSSPSLSFALYLELAGRKRSGRPWNTAGRPDETKQKQTRGWCISRRRQLGASPRGLGARGKHGLVNRFISNPSQDGPWDQSDPL